MQARHALFTGTGVARSLGAAMLGLGMGQAALAQDAANGLALAELWCNSCHSIGNEEPRMLDAGPQFVELAKQDAAYLGQAIDRPHDFMPEFPALSDADKADLIAHILSLN